MNILKKLRQKARYTEQQVADYLTVTLPEYLSYEEREVNGLSWKHLEKLAALYHVEEYDILTGTAVSHALCNTPAQETELIPFFTLVRNYLKMSRILDGADRDNPNYRINW